MPDIANEIEGLKITIQWRPYKDYSMLYTLLSHCVVCLNYEKKNRKLETNKLCKASSEKNYLFMDEMEVQMEL